jgi:hypothetical protein
MHKLLYENLFPKSFFISATKMFCNFFQGYITASISIAAFVGMFILQQVDPEKTRPYEFTFGVFGCFTLLIGHGFQIKDIIVSLLDCLG